MAYVLINIEFTTKIKTLSFSFKIGFDANIDKYVLPNPVASTNSAFYFFILYNFEKFVNILSYNSFYYILVLLYYNSYNPSKSFSLKHSIYGYILTSFKTS